MSEQEQMRANLEALLKKEEGLFKCGICHDPLLYSIQEMIADARTEGYQEGFEDGYIEGRQDEHSLQFIGSL